MPRLQVVRDRAAARRTDDGPDDPGPAAALDARRLASTAPGDGRPVATVLSSLTHGTRNGVDARLVAPVAPDDLLGGAA